MHMNFSAKIVIMNILFDEFYIKKFEEEKSRKNSSKRMTSHWLLPVTPFNFPNFFTWNVDRLGTTFHNTPDFSKPSEVRNNDNSDNFFDMCHPERTHKSHTKCMSGQLEQYLRSKSSWTTKMTWSCLLEVTKATESILSTKNSADVRKNCCHTSIWHVFSREFLTLGFWRDFLILRFFRDKFANAFSSRLLSY